MHNGREKQLVEISELGAQLKVPDIPTKYLKTAPAEALAHAKLVPVAVLTAQVHEIILDKDCEWRVDSGPIPRGATITAVNGVDIATHTADMIQQSKHKGRRLKGAAAPMITVETAMHDLAKESDHAHVIVTYVLSKNLVPTYQPHTADWLHPHNLSTEYQRARETLMAYRRAGELLRLVFDDITKDMRERQAYETESTTFAKRSLIRLGDQHLDYQGPELTAPPNPDPGAAVEQDAFCATKGCTRPHDGAFRPCEHTICCWECMNAISNLPDARCPVCNVPLSKGLAGAELDGDGYYLCYDEAPRSDSRLQLNSDMLHVPIGASNTGQQAGIRTGFPKRAPDKPSDGPLPDGWKRKVHRKTNVPTYYPPNSKQGQSYP